MRTTLLVVFLVTSWPCAGQSIPNLKLPFFVTHLSGNQKEMLRRAGAPKHNFISKTICFKYKCRAVLGWKRTQQRNKFKGYKKPGIPRLKYLQNDSIRRAEPQPQLQEAPLVYDTTSVAVTQPVPKDSVMSFVFDDVLFETNSSHLKDAFIERLDSLSTFVKKHESYHILIAGHTDNSGNERSNQRLSKDRAEAVASYLVSTGIDRSVITAEGRGSKEPIADNTKVAGREKNRRVEIFLSFH